MPLGPEPCPRCGSRLFRYAPGEQTCLACGEHLFAGHPPRMIEPAPEPAEPRKHPIQPERQAG